MVYTGTDIHVYNSWKLCKSLGYGGTVYYTGTDIHVYNSWKLIYMCSGSQGEFNEITPKFIGGWFIPISSHLTDLHRYDHRPHVRRPYVLHTLRAIARYSCYI